MHISLLPNARVFAYTGSKSEAKIKEEHEGSVYRDRHQNRPSKTSVIPCRHVPMFSRPDPSL
jgi:hypothetical protein